MNDKKFDLEDRLIDFAVAIIKFVENLPVSKSAVHLGGQLLRSLISIFVKSIVTATKK
ncbi:MAG: hypothetical protein WC854_12200 [Bacteroidales bacterium]